MSNTNDTIEQQIKAEAWFASEDMNLHTNDRHVFSNGYIAGRKASLLDGWVSVEDKLPKEHTDILVWVEQNKSSLCIEQSSYYNGRFESEHLVTHWRPLLPSPPKQ
jgi:hypothetical protein